MKRLFLVLLLIIPIAWAADFAFNRNLSIQQENIVLPADQAFHFEKTRVEGNTIFLSWKMTDGYYLYRDKIILKAKGMTLQPIQWPAGSQIKDDDMFGTQTVYYHKLQLPVQFIPLPDTKIATLTITYQGCQEKGICYPPMTDTFSFDPTKTSAAAAATPDTQATLPVDDNATSSEPQASLNSFFLSAPS